MEMFITFCLRFRRQLLATCGTCVLHSSTHVHYKGIVVTSCWQRLIAFNLPPYTSHTPHIHTTHTHHTHHTHHPLHTHTHTHTPPPPHTGADIANIVNEAALHAARYKKSGVREDDFEYAVCVIILSYYASSIILFVCHYLFCAVDMCVHDYVLHLATLHVIYGSFKSFYQYLERGAGLPSSKARKTGFSILFIDPLYQTEIDELLSPLSQLCSTTVR